MNPKIYARKCRKRKRLTVMSIMKKKCHQANIFPSIRVHLGTLLENTYRLSELNRKSIKEIINFMEVIYVE